MRRLVGIAILLLTFAIGAAGCGRTTQPQVAPVQAPSATVPSRPSLKAPDLPGDQAALSAALAEKSAVRYEVVVADDPAVTDKDAYLDHLLAEKHWPEGAMLVVVVFPASGFDARVAMGADFHTKQLNVDEMLTLLRTTYFAKARQNDPAGGLADLVRAVNQRMARP